MKLTTKFLLFNFLLSFYCGAYSQNIDTVSSTWRTEPLAKFYKNYTPLDYLRILKDDFTHKNKLNIFCVTASPDNWVKENHIDELMKLIYSTDSTKSVVSILSSYLSTDKFSSIGREAQNLIECFRTNSSYPRTLNSFGPPDKTKGKELEDWWTNYRKKK